MTLASVIVAGKCLDRNEGESEARKKRLLFWSPPPEGRLRIQLF